MHDSAIKTGKANAHGPNEPDACNAVSVATETCMLGKQFVGPSNF